MVQTWVACLIAPVFYFPLCYGPKIRKSNTKKQDVCKTIYIPQDKLNNRQDIRQDNKRTAISMSIE